MKSLIAIIEKFSKAEYNQDNYEVGGGLSDGKFASNRHEDAKKDAGKLTFGKAVQMFKKATKIENTDYIKEVLRYAVPNMEWHHAGMLPKSYGGGMKKTYFLNSAEIVMAAREWNSIIEKFEIAKAAKRNSEELKKSKEQVKFDFLSANAQRVERVATKPQFFFETNREMEGKFGWFSSYGKTYNLPEFFSGWAFKSEKDLDIFANL